MVEGETEYEAKKFWTRARGLNNWNTSSSSDQSIVPTLNRSYGRSTAPALCESLGSDTLWIARFLDRAVVRPCKHMIAQGFQKRMIYVPFTFEFRDRIYDKAGGPVTSSQIVIECNACYNVVKKSIKMAPTKACDRLQRDDRKHSRHKKKN